MTGAFPGESDFARFCSVLAARMQRVGSTLMDERQLSGISVIQLNGRL